MVVYNVSIADIQNVVNMAKFMVYVPVNGSINKIVDAESEQDALDKYLDEREDLLNTDMFQLTDDLDTAYIVRINDKVKC